MNKIYDDKIVKLTCDKAYRFANNKTETIYYKERKRFREENDRDTYQDFKESFTVKGMIKKLLIEIEPGAAPCCMSAGMFWMSSLFLLSPCFRCWFSRLAGKKKYVIIKEVSCN